jgi:hypothetical protein
MAMDTKMDSPPPSINLPPIKDVVIKEAPPPSSSRSMWPKGMQEAGARVPVSLGFLGAMLLGAFQLGSQRATDSEKIANEVRELKVAIAENTRELREVRDQCRMDARSLSVIETRTANTQAELVSIQSKLKP